MDWFHAQSVQYLNNARAQTLRRRGESPSASDAPNECPTCRTECFADPETGEPNIHRLFIHFGDGDGVGSSSQVGSSPMRCTDKVVGRKGKDKAMEGEVMAMARKARHLMGEINGLSADSSAERLDGVLSRLDSVKDHSVSEKAISGLRVMIIS